ncbi:MAG: hypothetical protein PHF70_02850 [Opitutales bacterium]|nr:hypothetical protein [Opitutales bacterium]
MKKTKQEGYFVVGFPNSVMIAETDGPDIPATLQNLSDHLNLDDSKSVYAPLLDLARLRSKKGFLTGIVGVSHPSFLLHGATIPSPQKAKDPQYIPNVIKGEMKVLDDNFYYHALGGATGLPYDPTKDPETEYIIAGIPNSKLAAIQDEIVINGFVPKRMECVTLSLIPLVRNALKNVGGEKSLVVILEIFGNSSLATMMTPDGDYAFRVIQGGDRTMCQAIKEENNLKDEDAARKLLYSETFDLSDMGPTLIRPLLRELSSISGYYEVTKGQSVGYIYVPTLPPSQNWIVELLAQSMGVEILRIDPIWAASECGVKLGASVKLDPHDARLAAMIALMGKF